MTETGSRLLLGVAAVLAGTTVLLAVFGLVYNPVLLLAALPFGAATYFLWSSATGRMDARMRERVATRRVEYGPGDGYGPGGDGGRGIDGGPRGRGRRRRDASRGPAGQQRQEVPGAPTHSRSAAARVLDVDPAADELEIRRAFREKARELHPDAPGGDEAEFRRVRTAYERLTDRR